MDICDAESDSFSSSNTSLKRRRDDLMNNNNIVTTNNNVENPSQQHNHQHNHQHHQQQRVFGGVIEHGYSSEETASSLCSNDISWSSAEINFKRLRIRGPSPTSLSSFSDCVIVEEDSNNQEEEQQKQYQLNNNENYSGFNNYLHQLHLERRNRLSMIQEQQQPQQNSITPLVSNNLQTDSCSVSASEGSTNGWTILNSDSKLY